MKNENPKAIRMSLSLDTKLEVSVLQNIGMTAILSPNESNSFHSSISIPSESTFLSNQELEATDGGFVI